MKEFGMYLGEHEGGETAVLLPKRQVPEGTKLGGELEIFIYRDSEDRLIATTGVPKLQVREVIILKVKKVGKIGASLDMGLGKDLLLPFKEQNHKVYQGEDCLVALHIDKSKQLAATVRVCLYMSGESSY